MKNRRLGRVCLLLAGLALISTSALAQKWTLSLGGAYMGGTKIGDATYSRSVPAGDDVYVSFNDSGRISASPKNNMSGTFGLMYSISKNWGILMQVGYMPSTAIDMKMRYALNWTFSTTDNSSSHSASSEETDTGDILVIPTNLNIVCTLPLSRTTLFNLSGGFSFLSAKLRLYSGMGHGVSYSTVVDDLYWKFTGSSSYDRTTKTVSWVDYYNLKLKSEETKDIMGFNFYLDLEQKFTKALGIFVGAYYCFVPEVEWTWELVPESRYEGAFGNLNSDATGGVSSFPETKSSVNLTHFSAVIGLKLHL
jgi:opacity protein-like surface antigen